MVTTVSEAVVPCNAELAVGTHANENFSVARPGREPAASFNMGVNPWYVPSGVNEYVAVGRTSDITLKSKCVSSTDQYAAQGVVD